jgi:hypothetical protein
MRRHWPIVAAVLGAVAIRAVVTLAYRPALLFPDSIRYLIQANSYYLSSVRPSLYPLLIWPVPHTTHSLMPIPIAQHVVVLTLACLCYAFLLRRGLPPWGATLGVLPLLFDPLQLVIEQFVLADVLFEVLLVSACLVLLWNHRPGTGRVVAVGLLIGFAGLTRGAGSFLVVVFLIALLCLRVSWPKVLAFVVAAVLPMGIYASFYQQEHGQFALVSSGPRFLYARIAPVVDCQRVQLPQFERTLCPSGPVSERRDTNYYMWDFETSAQYTVEPSHGMTQLQLVKDFDKRVIRAEPVVYAEAVLKDAAVGFAPTRNYEVPGYPASYWLFEDHYYSLDTFKEWFWSRWLYRYDTTYNATAASFLADYRRVLWTPGPLMALLLASAVAAAAGFGRGRHCGNRVAVGLMAGACATVLLTGAAFSGFSWRYQLTQIPMISMAGALGVAALLRGRAAGKPDPEPVPSVLDRSADLLVRLPVSAAVEARARQAADRGQLQTWVALALGVMAASLFAAATLVSGFVATGTAGMLGMATGLGTSVVLLVARARYATLCRPEQDEDRAGRREGSEQVPR